MSDRALWLDERCPTSGVRRAVAATRLVELLEPAAAAGRRATRHADGSNRRVSAEPPVSTGVALPIDAGHIVK